MSASSGNLATGFDINDLLLYLGAVVVAGVGLSWLFLAKPWADTASIGDATRESTTTLPASPAPAIQATAASDRTIEESLRLAGLAQAAGMLFEPPRYSAWALYREVLDADPSNAAGLDGVQRVGDAMVARAATALEQGRIEAANDSIDAVLARIPEHAAAQEMVTQIEASAARREAEEKADSQPTVAAAKPGEATRRRSIAAAAPAAVNPLRELRVRFDAAVTAGQLLQPDDESAKHVLNLMTKLTDSDPTVAEARETLLVALLERAEVATAAIDAAAATAWIDEASSLGADAERVEQARTALTERLIEVESQTPVPAVTLTLAAYTPPRYPSGARKAGIEGWVDLEFVVGTDGSTTDVTAVAGSHDNVFRQDAIAAVQNWRFEPRIVFDRPIPQRAYTRVRFVLE